jgi:hypothetical protein
MVFLFEANPAIRYIFYAQHGHKRMPLLSGLKGKSLKSIIYKILLKRNLISNVSP